MKLIYNKIYRIVNSSEDKTGVEYLFNIPKKLNKFDLNNLPFGILLGSISSSPGQEEFKDWTCACCKSVGWKHRR